MKSRTMLDIFTRQPDDFLNHQDVGRIVLEGYQLVSDRELRELRGRAARIEVQGLDQVIKTLDLCRHALVTPQGTTKTNKAQRAVAAIDQLLGQGVSSCS